MGKTTGMCIVLALAFGAASTQAHSPPPPPPPGTAADDDATDADSAFDTYMQARSDLYDTLRNDPSPRVQVLAGRIYLRDDDTPSALRPKREDVVARAAQLAPDDAFVQWMAADQGSYASNQCGPTRWPEAEVANLVRMEGDNAGALQFAVALAHAKGDAAALDDALARMAAAPRADDHLGEEVAAWRKAHAAHPSPGMMDGFWKNTVATPEASALLHTLQETAHRYSSAAATLGAVCKPDAQSERTWQRLGWCADAGRLLAAKGNSFALREQGLKLLAASGASGDDVAELQRQFDWLQAHAANPLQNTAAFEDAPADLVADWQGAPDEIVATEHRLKRLGQPLAAPPGWIKADAEEDADDKAARNAWQDYLGALLEDMRGSSDVRERALALAPSQRIQQMFGTAADAPAAPDADSADPLGELAAAHPDDLVVQWVAASAGDQARTGTASAAIANVQRLDRNNAAAWALSLPSAGNDTLPVLQRMATSSRYDAPVGEVLTAWLAAVQRHPLPRDVIEAMQAMLPSDAKMNAETTAGKGTATVMAMNSIGMSAFGNLADACARSGATDAARKDACAAIGRLMLNSGHSVIDAQIGEMLLRNADALGTREQERARQIAWWQSTQLGALAGGGPAFDAYFADYLSTGSEIEALRLAAARSGKTEPPAGWQSPAEKRAAKEK